MRCILPYDKPVLKKISKFQLKVESRGLGLYEAKVN
jgi:hypothetical protein